MDSTSLGATALLDTDFSSNTGWTIPDSSYIDITNNQIEFEAPTDSNTVRQIRYDFGENVVNTTKWVLRAKIDVTTLTASGGVGKQFFIGMKSGTGGQNVDYVGIRWRVQASPNNNAWFDSEVNGMPTSGSGASLVAPEVKTYYMEMKRLTSANTEVTLYNNSDYTGVYQSTVTDTGGASLGDLRYFTIHFQGNSGGSSAFAGTVDDVEFYNGVTSLDGCKNDFSATSDLDGLTGVRTNSIFQQTDDTPSYWWYDGTDWKLDGIAQLDINFSSDNFVDSTSLIGVDTTNTRLDYDIRRHSTNDISSYDFGEGEISNSKWVLRFKLTTDTITGGGSSHKMAFFGLSSGIGSWSSSVDKIGFHHQISSNSAERDIHPSYGDGADYNSGSQSELSTALTNSQTHYYELTRLSETKYRIKIRSGSHSGTLVEDEEYTIPSTIQNLRYFVIVNDNSYSVSGSLVGYINDLKFQNGRSTWLE